MKANAKVGDFVYYNHFKLCYIAAPKTLIEIGYVTWYPATNKYGTGLELKLNVETGWDYIKQINRERILWQKAKFRPGIYQPIIKAVFNFKGRFK